MPYDAISMQTLQVNCRIYKALFYCLAFRLLLAVWLINDYDNQSSDYNYIIYVTDRRRAKHSVYYCNRWRHCNTEYMDPLN